MLTMLAPLYFLSHPLTRPGHAVNKKKTSIYQPGFEVVRTGAVSASSD